MQNLKNVIGKFVVGCTVTGVVLATSQAFAQDDKTGPHPYVGGNYGLYKSDSGDYDEDRDLWELYGGFAFNQYLGVEVAYTNLGTLKSDYVEADIDGWAPAIVGNLPLGDVVSLYAKAGKIFWEADVSAPLYSDTFDGDEFFYTAGIGLAIFDPLSITLEYSQYDIDLEGPSILGDADEEKMDTVKLGARYAF